ncbi:MAG: hypothetical protein WCG47_03880 [Dermatophilaceae bacterium]
MASPTGTSVWSRLPVTAWLHQFLRGGEWRRSPLGSTISRSLICDHSRRFDVGRDLGYV